MSSKDGSASLCKCWDITVKAGDDSKAVEDTRLRLKKFMARECKSWVFQEERGEQSDYHHFQGRFIFKRKVRRRTLRAAILHYFEGDPGLHLSPSSAQVAKDAQAGKFDYVMKEDTRVAGPWSDETEPKPLTWDIKVLEEKKNWYSWQTQAYYMAVTRNPREIHVLYDPIGNHGKSSFLKYLELQGKCAYIPPFTDFQDIMQVAMAKSKLGSFWIDMPKAMHKEKLVQLWSAVETMKSGFLFDKRYHWKQMIIGAPQVIVSTNVLPKRGLLSEDRWRVWQIVDEHPYPLKAIELLEIVEDKEFPSFGPRVEEVDMDSESEKGF